MSKLGQGLPRHVRTPWRRCDGETETREESGFTLIELIIVALIIPIIIGAITLALISIFSLQGSTGSRISDSGDAQVVSSNFETDVQNATQITTAASGVTPQCVPTPLIANAVQVLGLQSADNGGTVISYADVPNGNHGFQSRAIRVSRGSQLVSREFHRHLEQRASNWSHGGRHL